MTLATGQTTEGSPSFLSNPFSSTEEARERIIRESKKLLGTPFTHNGRTRHGLDCAGFLYLVFHRSGLILPSNDGKTYQSNWFEFDKVDRYMSTLSKYFLQVNEPQMGDIILFHCFNRSRKVTHTGIYWMDKAFFHARSNKRVETASLNSRYWRSKYAGAMCYRGFMP